ncbi:MAG TPA: zf-HC2 domain-containing protein [Longimicrobium sp.]|nr:zf-HC2 domain-containing protein [Longimicrobium sp.]
MMPIPRPHPGIRRLKRFADQESSPREAARVAAHLERCPRCAESVGSFRRISSDLRGATAPEPSPDLLARILASRAAGERVVLPADADPAPVWRRRGVLAGLSAAAAAAVLLLARGNAPPPDGPEERWTTGLGLLPTPAYAEAAPVTLSWPPVPVDGTRVRPGTWTYEYRAKERSRTVASERGRVSIAPVRFGRAAAWRMESAWLGHPADIHEVVEFERVSLRVLHRTADNVGHSRYRVEEWLTGDTLRGTMVATVRNHRIRVNRYQPPEDGPYLAGESSPLIWLQAVRLRPGWRARVSLLGWGAVVDDRRYPIAFRVTGQGRARVSGRVWECWMVEAAAGGRIRTLWVRKADGVTVLSRETTPKGRLIEVALVGEAPAPRP